MISSTNAAYDLTIANSASPTYTLKVMTVIVVIFLPLVIVYQSWALPRLPQAPLGAESGGRRDEDDGPATTSGAATPAESS